MKEKEAEKINSSSLPQFRQPLLLLLFLAVLLLLLHRKNRSVNEIRSNPKRLEPSAHLLALFAQLSLALLLRRLLLPPLLGLLLLFQQLGLDPGRPFSIVKHTSNTIGVTNDLIITISFILFIITNDCHQKCFRRSRHQDNFPTISSFMND